MTISPLRIMDKILKPTTVWCSSSLLSLLAYPSESLPSLYFGADHFWQPTLLSEDIILLSIKLARMKLLGIYLQSFVDWTPRTKVQEFEDSPEPITDWFLSRWRLQMVWLPWWRRSKVHICPCSNCWSTMFEVQPWAGFSNIMLRSAT